MTNPKQRAIEGLNMIETAILEYIGSSTDGVSNSDIAKDLGLESDISGKHRNYLSWSILGNLLNKGLVQKVGHGRSSRYLTQ